MKIQDRLDCLEAIINELDIKTPISPNTLYDLQLHISMVQTEVKKLNIPDVIKSVCPICWFPLEDGIVKNMCINEQCPRNGGQTVL
jgi:hypothetical protein